MLLLNVMLGTEVKIKVTFCKFTFLIALNFVLKESWHDLAIDPVTDSCM